MQNVTRVTIGNSLEHPSQTGQEPDLRDRPRPGAEYAAASISPRSHYRAWSSVFHPLNMSVVLFGGFF